MSGIYFDNKGLIHSSQYDAEKANKQYLLEEGLQLQREQTLAMERMQLEAELHQHNVEKRMAEEATQHGYVFPYLFIYVPLITAMYVRGIASGVSAKRKKSPESLHF